eukprot:5422563-Amphidinium_carterae.1
MRVFTLKSWQFAGKRSAAASTKNITQCYRYTPSSSQTSTDVQPWQAPMTCVTRMTPKCFSALNIMPACMRMLAQSPPPHCHPPRADVEHAYDSVLRQPLSTIACARPLT